MAVTKQNILNELLRIAARDGGIPPGVDKFETETGIRESDWRGKYWVRWSEAQVEAGLAPNRRKEAFQDDLLCQKLVDLIRSLGHFPVVAEIKIARINDKHFPSQKVFERFGTKADLVAKVIEYCRRQSDLQDVIAICESAAPPTSSSGVASNGDPLSDGFVYLIRSGRFYKIGRTNATGRRQYELSIQLPEKASLIHEIKTDDAVNIEAYWHNRFRDRHKNGEWFELTHDDIRAFKRRKFM